MRDGILTTQNICCPREGPANTNWKLVGRPRWVLGSSKMDEIKKIKALYYIKSPLITNWYYNVPSFFWFDPF